MTPEQIKIVVAEVERLWRERTPALTIADAMPGERVNRHELGSIIRRYKFGDGFPIGDDDFDRAIFQLFDRLREEFPNERWEPRKNWSAATKQRRKELGLS